MDDETSLTISGFGDGAVLDDVTKLLGVWVNTDHSWIGDLQIELEHVLRRAELWYGDRYDMPGPDGIIERSGAIVTKLTKAELPY